MNEFSNSIDDIIKEYQFEEINENEIIDNEMNFIIKDEEKNELKEDE